MSTTTTAPVGPADAPESAPVDVRDRGDIARQIKLVVVFAIALVLTLLFKLGVTNPAVKYTLGERITADTPAHDLDASVALWLCILVCAAALVLALLNKVPRGWLGGLLFLAVGVAFFASFIIWNYADQEIARPLAIINPLPGAIRLSTPLVFGALAGVLCERSGVINIAIEGQFLMAAFFASVASSMAYSAEAGLLGGILAGVAMAALLAVFSLRYLVNQVVLGVVLIALATGLTAFLLSQIPNDPAIKQYLNEPVKLQRIPIPGLSEIPVIGPTLFNHTLLVYLMFLAVVVVTFLLYQTKWGLRVRAVGEHPKAADTVGIKVNRVRWQAVLLGGVLAGLGGAYFTVGSTGAFDQNASSGNGFIALAAVIMGRWHPIGASCAALFFGFMWTLQSQLQFLDKIPGELLRASPYLATIIAVAGFVGRVRPPAADGVPYVKS